MPAFTLAATRNLATGARTSGARAYAALALLAGVALVALTVWLPAPISLTPSEKTAIPPAALALGVVVLCSAALVALGALARRPRVTIWGYGVVVIAIPFLSGDLLAAVGEDRSAAAVAGATDRKSTRLNSSHGY